MPSIDTSDPAIKETWKAINDPDEIMGWALFGLEEDGRTLGVYKSGDGGYDEIMAALDDNRVLFGLLKVFAIDEKSDPPSRRARILFILWRGTGATAEQKFVAPMQRDDILRLFPMVIDYDVTSREAFSREAVIKRLVTYSGSKKPTHLELGPTDLAEI